MLEERQTEAREVEKQDDDDDQGGDPTVREIS